MIRKLFPLIEGREKRHLWWFLFTITIFAALQGVAVVLLCPTLSALFNGNIGEAWRWFIVTAGVTGMAAAAYSAQAQLGFRIALALLSGIHHRAGGHLATLPVGWFTGDKTGRLTQSLAGGVMTIVSVPANLMQPLITGVITPLTIAVGILFLDWRIGVAMLLCGTLLAAVYRWTGTLAGHAGHALEASDAESSGRLVEFAHAQQMLRAYSRTDGAHDLLRTAIAEQRRAHRTLTWSGAPGQALFTLAVQAGFTALLALGVTLALADSDPTTLVALLALTARFVAPLTLLADLGAAARYAEVNLARIDEVLNVPPLPERTTSGEDPPRPHNPEVRFDNVRFGYRPQEPVFSDVSFTAEAGTVTAIVGPSGAGKTTLARLVARFWDVDGGSVQVNGVDVREMTTATLMAQLSLVFQDVYLFDDTIEANIRMANPAATDQQVRIAAEIAGVDEIVDRLPDGYATRVGEGGRRLSGGERQRVSIARALLKDAPIVILDEATAALDPENEAVIRSAITTLSADRTVLVIAHRLHTIVSADQIIVLDSGAVVATGTHSDLVAQPGRYRDFWTERTRATGWRIRR